MAAIRILLVLVVMQAGASAAPLPSDQAWELARTVMSPYCPGMTLATCPSPAAAELRDEIARRFEEGESREVIVNALTDRFGDGIRGVPRTSGLGLLAWSMPGALALGLLVIVARVWRGSAQGADDPRPLPAGDEHLTTMLDAELERLD